MCLHEVEGIVSKECMEVTPETLDTSNLEATDEESNAMIECNAKATRSSKDNVHDYDDDTVEGPDDKSNTKVNIADDGDDCVLNNDFTEAKTLFEGTFIENYAAILKTLKMFPEAEIKDDDCTSQRNLSIPERLLENSSAASFDDILDKDPSPKDILDDVNLENHEDMNSTTSDITNDYVKESLQDKIVTKEPELREDKPELNDDKKPATTEILALSGSPRQKNVKGEPCCPDNSVLKVVALTLLLSMYCVLSMLHKVFSVILLALLNKLLHDRPVVGCKVLPKQGEVHKPDRKTVLVDWPVVEIPDYKVVEEFDNKPVHGLQKDLLSKSEQYEVELVSLLYTTNTDLVMDMHDEERCTYLNHRLACTLIYNLIPQNDTLS